MKKNRAIRKRSFLLFELMVSLALIAVCLFPLMTTQAKMRKIERDMLKNMFFEREAETAFCFLKEKLFQNEIPWDRLINFQGIIDKEGSGWVFRDKKYTCHVALLKIEERCRSHSTKEKLVSIKAKIHFASLHDTSVPYFFYLTVEKKLYET